MCITIEERAKIVHYLKTRLGYLSTCNAEIEGKLSLDSIECINSGGDNDSIGRRFFQIDSMIGNTFRYSMLIAVCSFLEESLKLLCKLALHDYETKLDAIKKKSWLSRHRLILCEHLSADLSAVVDDWDTMEDFVTIRNCIVHAWGKLDQYQYQRDVWKIVDKLEEAEKKNGKSSYLHVSADGFLVVEDDAVPTAMCASLSIVEKLLRDVTGVS